MSGLFVIFDEQLPPHTPCEVQLSFLTNSGKKDWISAEVARVIRPDHRDPGRNAGLGIKFNGLDTSTEEELRCFIHDKLNERPDHLKFYF